ncbi:hypothetical protein [Glycomyces arizonensis]|uniref:hypothetical protein n=1 Tax=Glycomyces arizonensis TaxID=256035 RepID=UPI00040C9F04|nr:hypothetical protein [Glycomyces arizonensis]
MKKWLIRFGVTCAVGVAMIAGLSSPAMAGDTWLIASDIDGRQVGAMQHVDDGDDFRVYDSWADGYGIEGCVQLYSPKGGWITQRCKHNGEGAGSYVTFGYNVLEGLAYRMRLCHGITGCVYQGFHE